MHTLFEQREIRVLLTVRYLKREGATLYYQRKGRKQLLAWASDNRYALASSPVQETAAGDPLPITHRKKMMVLFDQLRRVGAKLGLTEVDLQERAEENPEATAYPAFPPLFVRPSAEGKTYLLTEQTRKALAAIYRLVEAGHKEVILVTGPTGTGKTTLAEHFALKLHRPLFIVDCGAYGDALDFFGAKDLAMRGGRQVIEWFEHDFVRAVETEQAVVVLDEANRLHPTHLNALFPLFDHRGRIFIPGMPHPVVVAPGVTFFVTMNLGAAYTGTYQADPAFMNRMTRHLETYYLDPEQEQQLVEGRTGLPSQQAKQLTKLAARIRELAIREDALLRQAVSTRDVIKTAEIMQHGLNLEMAVRATFLHNYSADGGASSERATVLQALQSIG